MGLLDRFRKSRRRVPQEPAAGPAVEIPRGRAEVLASLQAFVASRSDERLTPDQVDPAASLMEEAILDSVGSLELLDYVENTWAVSIAESELVGQFHCLDHLVDHITENLADDG